jgi:hypothetical protein
MEAKTPQFSAYDILGYLVPGLSLILLIDCSIAFHSEEIALTYKSITSRYSTISWGTAIPLLLISYFLGHMVSFVSSMTIERHAKWRYGHPMEFLLSETNASLPDYFATSGRNSKWSKGLRFITAVSILPIFIFEYPLVITKVIQNYIRSLGPDLGKAVRKAIKGLCDRCGVSLSVSKEYPAEFELLAINYALETAPSHVFTLRNYVVLYGFLRSMTFILVMSTWIITLHVGYTFMRYEDGLSIGILYTILVFIASGFLCAVSYGAFLKFWTRYNKEALMGITAVFLKENADKV